jgi:hypothetical protein
MCYALDVSINNPPMTVDSLKGATQVLVAEVRGIESSTFNTRDQKRPSITPREHDGVRPLVVTPYNLHVVETIRGSAEGGVVRAVAPGGVADCIEYNVSPGIGIERNRTYLFFLYPGEDIDGGKHPELPMIWAAWPIDTQDGVTTESEGVVNLEAIRAVVEAVD